MRPNPLTPLFDPTSVAVFGASASGNSVGAKLYANLLAAGFSGPVVPINPKYKDIGGVACHASHLDVDDHIDLAVIATPAPAVPGIIRDCAKAGTRHAIVLSAGFGEVGDSGKALEAELLDTARRNGVRLLGPNCVGLVRPTIGMNATFLKSATPRGRLALVSQSGALCSAISDWAGPNHLGFSALVSLGNSADIGFGDVVQYLAADPDTDAILLYVEGVRHARSFLSALRGAARVKPVIVLKSGRHTQSSKAATTHTGALIGSDAVFDAALGRVGAVRVDTFGQLFAAAEVLAARRRAGGDRLGIITNGGGAGVLAADRAGDYQIDLPHPKEKTLNVLDETVSPHWSHGNPIDILGDATADQFGAAVKAGMADNAFDGLLVMLTPQAMTDATAAAQAVIDAVGKRPKKPILACWMGAASVQEGRELLSKNGIPDFTTPERAVEAFSYLARHHTNRQLALEIPGPLSDMDPPDLEGARMIIQGTLSDGRSMLSDVEAKALMRSFHIPTTTTLTADSAASALIAAETVGFPVAMKISSPQISHKSDVHGVRTNIMTAADVKLAYREIMAAAAAARPDATLLGVTVEQMARIEDARELLIGASRDPVFGPSIMFGAGGTMVEVLRDSSVTLPPLNEVLANRLIDRTRVSRLLEAVRDRAEVDRAAVIDVLRRVSELVTELPEVQELDINPLFAGPEGVLAVDVRIAVKRPPAGEGPYEHLVIEPYPKQLIREYHLDDGTPLTIRPIRPEDAEIEQAFVRELSPQAKQFRFMGALNELSPTMLSQFTQIDYAREMALVAVANEDGKLHQHGVARYYINDDNSSCEFAIVVSDKLQHQGIGTKLMKSLMQAARDHGLTSIEGAVLARNQPMLDLMEDLGFTIRKPAGENEIVQVERQL
ncbi:bifunctional acetate--CoA ligase family protein/GNAT family N-acetyltransferase [uncultured Roseovarius sp.]|uniref:bifunctional acetate--CoA ligase family protein/GNAT family N-acetyltransferase n=1 Tax=uncultured Roseovarius sp. TaxID=293344 RepID=UPI002605B265|nr:bifunctional acetate--CoA ligase family protein/GNAT family N-acetyltransferase [uncultured Roseovarius sp.]